MTWVSRIEKEVVYNIMDDNNITAVDVDFILLQNGQDSNGNNNGTYTIVGVRK
ncbi:MAG: hypothetical protein K2P59_09165 [Acetatifactor sp.]|nr:hypothetical protein [Acetatifactor sp.]